MSARRARASTFTAALWTYGNGRAPLARLGLGHGLGDEALLQQNEVDEPSIFGRAGQTGRQAEREPEETQGGGQSPNGKSSGGESATQAAHRPSSRAAAQPHALAVAQCARVVVVHAADGGFERGLVEVLAKGAQGVANLRDDVGEKKKGAYAPSMSMSGGRRQIWVRERAAGQRAGREREKGTRKERRTPASFGLLIPRSTTSQRTGATQKRRRLHAASVEPLAQARGRERIVGSDGKERAAVWKRGKGGVALPRRSAFLCLLTSRRSMSPEWLESVALNCAAIFFSCASCAQDAGRVEGEEEQRKAKGETVSRKKKRPPCAPSSAASGYAPGP